MERNIRLSFLTNAFFQALFWMGIWVSFYLLFTDYKGIGIIELIAYASSFLFEIPTGAIADFFGKKKTLMAAFLITGLNALIMGSAQNYSMLLVAVVLAGLGYALYSGTHHAFVFDSLKTLGREAEFDSIISKMTSIGLVSTSLASVIGGIAYSINPSLPFYLLALACFIALVLSFFFVEPPIDSDIFSMSEFARKTVVGFQVLKQGIVLKPILSLLIVSSIAIILISSSLDNALAVGYGMSETAMGILFSITILAGAIGNYLYPRLKSLFGFTGLAVISLVILVGTSMVAPLVGMTLGSIAILVRFLIYQWPEIQASAVINSLVESNSRATALSTFSMLSRLPYLFLAVPIGVYIEKIGSAQTTSYLGIGILLSGALIVSSTYSIASKKNKMFK